MAFACGRRCAASHSTARAQQPKQKHKAPRWAAALAAAEAAPEPTLRAWTKAAVQLARAGRWERALALLHSDLLAAGPTAPDALAYNALLHAYAKAAPSPQWARALTLLATMAARRAPPTGVSYGAAISACAKAAQWAPALALLREMGAHNVPPDVIAWNAALSACEKGLQWARAVALLNQMPSASLAPDVVSFTATVGAVARGAQWAQALALIARMHDGAVAPNEMTYCAALTACQRGQQWQLALDLLHAMLRAKSVRPDAACYRVAVAACEEAGNAAVAARLYDYAYAQGAMEHIAPDEPFAVDLHEHSFSTAKVALRAVLALVRDGAGALEDLVLIVGQRRNTPGRAVLKPALVRWLQEEVEPPLFALEEAKNPGRLRVARAALERWRHGGARILG